MLDPSELGARRGDSQALARAPSLQPQPHPCVWVLRSARSSPGHRPPIGRSPTRSFEQRILVTWALELSLRGGPPLWS